MTEKEFQLCLEDKPQEKNEILAASRLNAFVCAGNTSLLKGKKHNKPSLPQLVSLPNVNDPNSRICNVDMTLNLVTKECSFISVFREGGFVKCFSYGKVDHDGTDSNDSELIAIEQGLLMCEKNKKSNFVMVTDNTTAADWVNNDVVRIPNENRDQILWRWSIIE